MTRVGIERVDARGSTTARQYEEPDVNRSAMSHLSAVRPVTPRGGAGCDPAEGHELHWPPSAAWHEGFGERDWRLALADLDHRDIDAVAIEVYLPFCAMRCLYCDSDVSVTHDDAVIDRYIDALVREMDLACLQIGRRREALQVHLDGGTPNHLNEAQLVRVVDAIGRHFRILAETELSIACDPRRCSTAQIEWLYTLGFRRITFGMAELQPSVQAAVGRVHTAARVQDAIDAARDTGFECIELDLVCGLPTQTEARLRDTLEQVIRLGPDRLTCLPYRHRPSMFWEQAAIAAEHMPTLPEARALRQLAVDGLTDAGYTWIGPDRFVLDLDELSLAQSHGRLGHSALGFNAAPVEHVLAFGCGRVSDVAGTLMRSEASLPDWQDLLARGRLPVVQGHRRSAAECRRRDAITHLLCALELPAVMADDELQPGYQRLARLGEQGLVDVRPDRLCVTRLGQYQLDRLCAEFDARRTFPRLHRGTASHLGQVS